MSTHPLHSFFWPQSIAVLGASPDLHRIRGRLLTATDTRTNAGCSRLTWKVQNFSFLPEP